MIAIVFKSKGIGQLQHNHHVEMFVPFEAWSFLFRFLRPATCLMKSSTAVATASCSTFEGTPIVHCIQYDMSYLVCSSCRVPSEYPQRYSNLICRSHSGIYTLYDTYVAGQEESGCVCSDCMLIYISTTSLNYEEIKLCLYFLHAMKEKIVYRKQA